MCMSQALSKALRMQQEYNQMKSIHHDTFILIERKPINGQANIQIRKMPVDDVLVMERNWGTIILFFCHNLVAIIILLFPRIPESQ